MKGTFRDTGRPEGTTCNREETCQTEQSFSPVRLLHFKKTGFLKAIRTAVLRKRLKTVSRQLPLLKFPPFHVMLIHETRPSAFQQCLQVRNAFQITNISTFYWAQFSRRTFPPPRNLACRHPLMQAETLHHARTRRTHSFDYGLRYRRDTRSSPCCMPQNEVKSLITREPTSQHEVCTVQ